MELYFGTIKDTGSRIGISYIDVAEWEWHRFPLVRNFIVQFPEKENEIMAALWLLEDIGIKEPELGMVVSVTYFDKDNAAHSQEFILSGYFENNSYIRSGGRGNLYVSPAFAMSADKMSETLYMDLTESNKENALQQLAAELRLQSGQSLTLSPAYESAGKASWITIGFLVLLSC